METPMPKILVLEDDYRTAESLEEAIASELAEFHPEVEVLGTEAEFVLNWLPEFKKGSKQRPDVIVIDVMLRWTDPAPAQPVPPPEVIEGGFARAGLRCYGLIQGEHALSRSKVILFTNLDEKDMSSLGGKPSGLLFIPKGQEDAILRPLRSALESVVASPNVLSSSAHSDSQIP